MAKSYISNDVKREIIRQLAADGPQELASLQRLVIEQKDTCKRDVLCSLVSLSCEGYVVQYEPGGAWELTDSGYALSDRLF